MTKKFSISFEVLSLLMASLVSILVCLHTLYNLVSIEKWPWIGPMIIHTALLIPILTFRWKFPVYCMNWKETGRYLLLGPLLLSLAAATAYISGGVGQKQVISPHHWVWIFFIPVVEETVFRGGIGQFFRNKFHPFWGAYFSAIVFALAHVKINASDLLKFHLPFPLGPFILGLICEMLLEKTGRLLIPIVFHACCNATVVVFQYFDPRWLDWLGYLYLDA